MAIELREKNALITGASYGLGYACACMLAEQGVNVAIVARNHNADLPQSARKIGEEYGVIAEQIYADLTIKHQLNSISQTAKERLGDIDILVVSTGHPPIADYLAATPEQLDQGYELVVRPAFLLPQQFLPTMADKGYGRVIYMGSSFINHPNPRSAVQSVLRRTYIAIAEMINNMYVGKGINSNVIVPGHFDTRGLREIVAKHIAERDSTTQTEVLERMEQENPSGELGDPDDLGRKVVELASKEDRTPKVCVPCNWKQPS